MSEYNTEEKLLKNSIYSILKQTYKNIELIIIDDSGNRTLKEKIKNIKDSRIKIYENKKNMGLVYSLNKALKLSNGEYIARMDTDDISHSDRIIKQLSFLEENKEISILGTRCRYYDENGVWGESIFYGKVGKKDMINGNKITHPTVMFRKKILLENGGYLDYKRCEDSATWYNLFSLGYNFYVLKDTLLDYHLSKSDYKKRSIKNRLNSYKVIHEQYTKLTPTNKQILKKYLQLTLSGILPKTVMYKYHRKKISRKTKGEI